MTTTSPDTLTPRQRRFVNEYLVALNGTQAAIRAGYSKRTAHVAASRLLKNVNVALEIRRQQALMQEDLKITRETVLNGLHEIASNPNAHDGARVSAWVNLAKIIGAYVEKTEQVHSIDHIAHAMQGLSIEELKVLANPQDNGPTNPSTNPSTLELPIATSNDAIVDSTSRVVS